MKGLCVRIVSTVGRLLKRARRTTAFDGGDITNSSSSSTWSAQDVFMYNSVLERVSNVK